MWEVRRGNGRDGEMCGDKGSHVFVWEERRGNIGGIGRGVGMRDGICCVGGGEREWEGHVFCGR